MTGNIKRLLDRLTVYEEELADARAEGIPDDARCMVDLVQAVLVLHDEITLLDELAAKILARFPAI